MTAATHAGTIDVQLAGKLGDFALDVAFTAPGAGITALFGPSGCGKTSVLRSLAGLHHLSGRIAVADEVWQDSSRFVKPHRRAVGYVFQEASLFPHLSVRGNLLYGERRAGGADAAIRLEEVVDLLGLSQLVDRAPAHLSGGERQRVAIGRALLSRPSLLLMDEPLAALDRIARDEILPYLEALHARLSLPILLVTHDVSEVMRLADHLVLLKEGRVLASGALSDVLTQEASPLQALREFATVLDGVVRQRDPDGVVAVEAAGVRFLAVAPNLAAGRAVRVRIAASDVSLTRTPSAETSILNVLPATVVGIDSAGPGEAHVRLSLGAGPQTVLVARLSRRSVERMGLHSGDRIHAQVKSVALVPTG